MELKGFKTSPIKILCPIRKVKVKKTHYKCLLILAATAIWGAHELVPYYEQQVIFMTNLLFIFDPTV